jgi:hypothetical protein
LYTEQEPLASGGALLLLFIKEGRAARRAIEANWGYSDDNS